MATLLAMGRIERSDKPHKPADLTCPFPFDLRKKPVISTYEWRAKNSALNCQAAWSPQGRTQDVGDGRVERVEWNGRDESGAPHVPVHGSKRGHAVMRVLQNTYLTRERRTICLNLVAEGCR